jgi:hypothetical protein
MAKLLNVRTVDLQHMPINGLIFVMNNTKQMLALAPFAVVV